MFERVEPSRERLQRVRRGVPMILLARELGIATSTLSLFERGLTRLEEKTEQRRKKLLGVGVRVNGSSKLGDMLGSGSRQEHGRASRS